MIAAIGKLNLFVKSEAVGQMEIVTSTKKTKSETVEVSAESSAEKRSDHALLIATREGDDRAFEELVNRYRGVITNFLYRMLNDYDEAIDLAQETFVRIFCAIERYHTDYAFSTYIYRIATNLAISELRKRKRRRLISLNGMLTFNDENKPTEFELPDQKPLPDAVFADVQIQAIVRSAIATMPEKYRAPLVLRDVEGKSYEEISQILETNEGTIKSRISRGRNLLREKLKKHF